MRARIFFTVFIMLPGIIGVIPSCTSSMKVHSKYHNENNIPPGQMKKITGSKSASEFAPGHRK